MSRIIEYWCDSGANIHSCVRGEISLDELGLTDDEWDNMTDLEQEEEIKPYALDRLDWGFCEKE